ncbi:MAG: 2-amino-4-hydroxy-6-hydroxymethyldihydropteridine diphosphokinase [Bacteroidetes bacterium]|nr:2-amino-4-hydroxy-6-hydroxymethyldihydropteridine diphosphokinase [Bacteroidota bacterium]
MGKREKFLPCAIGHIEKKIGKVILKSSLYNTKAWGIQNQNDFLNQAICVETILSAEKLLEEILLIEKQLGRERANKWEARKIDIDILFFNKLILQSAHLQIPHPHLHERKFTLVPLNEIASGLIHPVLGKSIKILLQDCTDKLEVSLVM